MKDNFVIVIPNPIKAIKRQATNSKNKLKETKANVAHSIERIKTIPAAVKATLTAE